MSAAPPSSAAPASPPKLDPKGKKGISPQMTKLQKGHAAYLARDYPAAVSAYKEATTLEPAEPSAFYFLGAAELAAGNASGAEADLQKGLQSSSASDEWHTKLLDAVAELCERQSRFAEARKAWEELVQFASAHTATKAAAASALQRIQAIDAHLELETKSAAVKQRIEQRLRETGSPPPDEKAPAKPKK
jgi:tetratricopeptide (TPR) repeat protein